MWLTMEMFQVFGLEINLKTCPIDWWYAFSIAHSNFMYKGRLHTGKLLNVLLVFEMYLYYNGQHT